MGTKFLAFGMVLVITVLALLTACAPATQTTPAAPVPKTTASPSPTVSPAPTAAAMQPKSGGVLNYPIRVYPAGFDVHRKVSFSPFVGMPVFSNLVKFDPSKAEISPGNIIPDLAEKWETTPDGKTWTFTLRKGVKWHDGMPFTAEDVVYSLDKMRDAKRSSITSYFANVERLEKTDDTTVKVYLSAPSAFFFTALASGYCSIQPKHLSAVDMRLPEFLVGTGPFKIKKVTSGVSVELVKNPDYFIKGKPYLDGLTLFVMADRSAQADAFASKRVDMTTPGPGITSQDVLDQYKKNAPDAVYEFVKYSYGPAMFFNMKNEQLKDPRVRRALSIMTDRKEMLVAAFGSDVWGDLTHAFFSSTYGLSTDEINKITGWDKPLDARIAEAKKLLAEAGYPTGLKIKWPTSLLPEGIRRMAVAVDNYRKYLNVECETANYDNAIIFQMRDKGDFGIIDTDTLALLSDPDELMGFFKTGSASNFSGYSNPELDKLWESQVKEMDLAKRQQITREIERKLLTDAVAVPLNMVSYGAARWPYVKGWVVQNASYTSNMTFVDVWLDK
jgi:peptide/nickel transport system substrate-binding protein